MIEIKIILAQAIILIVKGERLFLLFLLYPEVPFPLNIVKAYLQYAK